MGTPTALLFEYTPGAASARLDRVELPAEIRFLVGHLPVSTLEDAADRALRDGVTAESFLLGEGLIGSEAYYRHLAAHLGVPFAERPLKPAATSTLDDVVRTGVAALSADPSGWRYLAAPRGAALQRLLHLFDGARRPIPGLLAVTSPERLEALMRYDRRREVAKTASHGLPDWNGALSARAGITPAQAGTLLAAAFLFCAAAWQAPGATLLACNLGVTAAFLMAVILRLAAAAASPRVKPTRTPRALNADLPIYTVIVPLFREARVVDRLVAALDRLDYPKSKLDIIFAVEASDTATLDAIERLGLPARYRTIMAPDGRPRTKPRALNVALQFARGNLAVVYDAEDEPEPNQLRAAVQTFASNPALACLQARLAIDNFGDSWLTMLFALEYAALFHVINPGLAALRLPIPLGGTSNHFRIDVLRRINGWDAWNVTEDVDLGIRLARFGFRVGSLDSTTYEEAPNTLAAWLKQRTRWMKGWMVTLGTHSREPARLWRELRTLPTFAVTAMVFGTIASSLLGPLCIAMLIVRAATGTLFWARTPLPFWMVGASAALLGLGVVSAVWPILVGLSRRGLLRLWPWLFLYPAYLVVLFMASWQAAFEAFGRPHSWSKTEHGRAKARIRSA